MVGSRVIAGPFGKFQKDYLRELYLADFLFRKFSFIANQFVLWFRGNAVADVEELLISISGVSSLFVDLCVDVYPAF